MTGCQKLTIALFLGILNFKIITINMNLFIEIRYNILLQCLRNCIEVEKIQLCVKNLLFKEFPTKYFGCPER